jgi:hypothetical protein
MADKILDFDGMRPESVERVTAVSKYERSESLSTSMRPLRDGAMTGWFSNPSRMLDKTSISNVQGPAQFENPGLGLAYLGSGLLGT